MTADVKVVGGVRGDFVCLPPDRWQSLVDYIRVNYGDQRPGEEITVYEATDVQGILFLSAVYRAA